MYQFRRGISGGPALKYFYFIHRGGRVPAMLAANKIGDLTKLEILVQNGSFCSIVGARPIAAPRISARDNEAGKISV